MAAPHQQQPQPVNLYRRRDVLLDELSDAELIKRQIFSHTSCFFWFDIPGTLKLAFSTWLCSLYSSTKWSDSVTPIGLPHTFGSRCHGTASSSGCGGTVCVTRAGKQTLFTPSSTGIYFIPKRISILLCFSSPKAALWREEILEAQKYYQKHILFHIFQSNKLKALRSSGWSLPGL